MALSLFVAGTIGACSGEKASSNMVASVPAMDGAYNVRNVGNKDFQQFYYNIKAVYPSVEALDFYDRYFVVNGWKRCIGGVEKWQSFIDATGSPEKVIHQVAHYFIKEDESKFSMIGLRYKSKKRNGAGEDIPDSDVQHVYITVEVNTNLQQWQQELSLSCNGAEGQAQK
jgi:hypothetical protein